MFFLWTPQEVVLLCRWVIHGGREWGELVPSYYWASVSQADVSFAVFAPIAPGPADVVAHVQVRAYTRLCLAALGTSPSRMTM